MSFTLKPKNTGGSSVDWEAINSQVEEGTQVGRISLIVDLGEQAGTEAVSDKDADEKPVATIVDTQEEAEALIEKAGDLVAKFKKVKATQVDGKWSVPFKIYHTKDCQQVAIFVDLVDILVDYGDGKPKPYRIMLNPNFKGNIRGFDLKASPPKGKGNKLWTFAPNSTLYKLARATKAMEIISEGDDNMNIGLLLNKPLLVEVVKNEGYVSIKNYTPIMKGQAASELPFEALGVSFSNVTLELLNKALLRKGIFDKIKTALNYDKPEGAKMRAAIAAYEAKFESGGSSSDAAEQSTGNQNQENDAAEHAEEPEPDFDDDCPFD